MLVDDLSRLSRELGSTINIIFGLQRAGIVVTDITKGLSSNAPGARLMMGTLALVNDQFLEIVRAQTHRGLEGRVRAGFSTGGRCYGYATTPEENPPDPDHPRKLLRIVDAEAEILRRIFRLYADGWGYGRIAKKLNEERIPSPSGGTRWAAKRRGWAESSIREILHNKRFIGFLPWNESKWVRDPEKRSRTRVERPASEWIAVHRPELAIIDMELWDAVQARLRSHAGKSGRPKGAASSRYALSGLLTCATCGGSMTVVACSVKAGVRRPRFGCAAHHRKGKAICTNDLTVDEARATGRILDALRARLMKPALVCAAMRGFNERVVELERARASDPSIGDVDQEIGSAELRVRNLADAVARDGYSEALGTHLRGEEARLAGTAEEGVWAAAQHPPDKALGQGGRGHDPESRGHPPGGGRTGEWRASAARGGSDDDAARGGRAEVLRGRRCLRSCCSCGA